MTQNKEQLYIILQGMIAEYMATPEFYSLPHQFKPFIERYAELITALQSEQAGVNKELLRALREAKDTIYALHGDECWNEYQHSPEMKIINAAISDAEKENV